MLPYKTILHIDKSASIPLYLQICNEFIKRISDGTISPTQKIPSSRMLSELLKVNRRTVGSAYEELEAQGWIEIKASQGSFVSSKLPVLKTRSLQRGVKSSPRMESSFSIPTKMNFLEYYEPPDAKNIRLIIDAGYPDVRLAPLQQLTRNLTSISKNKRQVKLMNYSNSFNGDIRLQEEMIKCLAETRGIKVGLENIFITRGSLMAFFLIFQIILNRNDNVIVGDVSFKVANNIIRLNHGNLIEVPVDEKGIDVDAIETVCKKKEIKAVFIMPHHHNPTTVSLTAERRMKLLMLAEQYKFAIIEDDYDYDFHYASSPILPMASSDRSGSVVYVGSLSKTVAPSLRMGFIVAPKNLIDDVSRLSRFMDCHGNIALERAIAMLYRDGEIRRHLKKSLRAYHVRRDVFCETLKKEFGDLVTFKIPEGGLAVWVKFDKTISVKRLREICLTKGLQITKPIFQKNKKEKWNAIRMGFASLNEKEIVEALGILKAAMEEMRKLPM